MIVLSHLTLFSLITIFLVLGSAVRAQPPGEFVREHHYGHDRGITTTLASSQHNILKGDIGLLMGVNTKNVRKGSKDPSIYKKPKKKSVRPSKKTGSPKSDRTRNGKGGDREKKDNRILRRNDRRGRIERGNVK